MFSPFSFRAAWWKRSNPTRQKQDLGIPKGLKWVRRQVSRGQQSRGVCGVCPLEAQCGACGQTSPKTGRNGTRKTARHNFVCHGQEQVGTIVDLPSPASSWYSRSHSQTRSHPSWRHVSIGVCSRVDVEVLDGVQSGPTRPPRRQSRSQNQAAASPRPCRRTRCPLRQ